MSCNRELSGSVWTTRFEGAQESCDEVGRNSRCGNAGGPALARRVRRNFSAKRRSGLVLLGRESFCCPVYESSIVRLQSSSPEWTRNHSN